MRLPQNWNDITIEQFQECYFLLGKNPTIETWVMVLSTLSGKTYAQVEALSIKHLKELINGLQFLLQPNLNEKVNKFVAFRGKPFKACLDASQMGMNQINDLKEFMKPNGQPVEDTIVENAHKLLACIYVPLTLKGWRYVPSKHKAHAEKFKQAKMGDIYGTLFFYSGIYKTLIQTTDTYLKEQTQILKEHLEEVNEWAQKQTLQKDGVGK